MSETDDTDVLVLIPPNFFSVHSSSEDSLLDSSRTVVHKPSCTAQVIVKLVDQVHSLENRLESLELTSDSSYCGRSPHKTWDFSASVDSVSVTKFSTFPRRRRRKTAAQRDRRKDLSLTSLDSLSSYSKIIPPLLLNKPHLKSESGVDDICSMDGDLSSIISTPSKKNDKLLLHEIDEFLTKVESYEIPDDKLKSAESTLTPENVIKATGDYLNKKNDLRNSMDDIRLPSGRVVTSAVLEKYIYLTKNSASSAQAENSSTSNYKNRSQTNDSTAKATDETPKHSQDQQKPLTDTKSPSIRRLNFLEKDIQPTSTPKRHEPYQHTFRPSTNKIYERTSKVLEQYKHSYSHPQNTSIDKSYLTSPKKDEFKVPNTRTYGNLDKDRLHPSLLQTSKFMDTIDTELLSLTEMWGDKREDKADSLRLEEEKMKREHCEALIQELQKKLLDQQERLAVAIKVDRSKDIAISKLREAWSRLTNGLERTEERHKAEVESVRKEVEGIRVVADENKKKALHFEAELYKTLDLAHDYQDKCKHLSNANEKVKQNTEKLLQDKDEVIKQKERENEVLRENYETVMRLNKQATDCVKSVEETLEKERQDHDQTKLKLAEFARQLQTSQEESDVIRSERDILKIKVHEERARWSERETQLADRQNQCSELVRRCDTLEIENKHLHTQLEVQKQTLKQHYQQQLETAVVSKLREFQLQLEVAERGIEGEWRAREGAQREEFVKEAELREDQHKLEIKVLEEKHKEEAKLYRLQLAQASEKISLLESKLSSHRARRGLLAEQLHAVMEAQWRQARAILTGKPGREHDNTRSDIVSTPDAQDYSKIPSLSLPPLGSLGPLGPLGPLGSLRREPEGLLNFDTLSDGELQHYVKMLLTKPPNLDASGDAPLVQQEAQKDVEEPSSDRDRAERRDKRRNVSKPPWKA